MLDTDWMIAYNTSTEVTSSTISRPRVVVNCITSDLIGLSEIPFICSAEWTPAVQFCCRSTLSDTSALDTAMWMCHQQTGDDTERLIDDWQGAMYSKKETVNRDDPRGTRVSMKETRRTSFASGAQTSIELSSKKWSSQVYFPSLQMCVRADWQAFYGWCNQMPLSNWMLWPIKLRHETYK